MDVKPFGHAVNAYTKAAEKDKSSPPGQTVADMAQQKNAAELKAANKQALNRSILQLNEQVQLQAGNQSMALLYKSAIEHINEILEPEFGPNAAQQAFDSGLDVSPQATAERIVAMSTAFFAAFQERHPELDIEQAAEQFSALIGSGIDRGFAEAREILDGLKVLEGEIASNIDKTYALVQQGLADFVAQYQPDQQA